MRRVVFALIATLATATVFADDLPKPDCAKPELPSKFATEATFKLFNRHVKEYNECIKKFVDVQNEISKQAVAAGNAAIAEFNDLQKQIQAMQPDQQ